MRRFQTALFYCGFVLLWSAIITAGGAVVGAILFPLVGRLAGMDLTIPAMVLSGARQIGFLTFIWAPGIAIVMAFQRAYRLRHGQRPGTASAVSSAENDG